VSVLFCQSLLLQSSVAVFQMMMTVHDGQVSRDDKNKKDGFAKLVSTAKFAYLQENRVKAIKFV
jgi:hypothetical protein